MSTINHALALHKAGKLEQAEAACRNIIASEKFHPDVAHLLGGILLQQAKVAEGIKWITKAISAKPKTESYYLTLAKFHASQHAEAESVKSLTQLKKACPKSTQPFIEMARIYGATSQFEGAVFCYQHLAKVIPNNPAVFFNLGNAHRSMNAFQKAEKAYRKALSIKPDLLEAILNLALCLESQNKLAEACEAYKLGLKINPNHYSASMKLAALLMSNSDKPGAMHYAEHALKLEPGSIDALLCLAPIKLDQNDYDTVLDYCERILAVNKNDAAALNYKGVVMGRLGKHDECYRYLTLAAEASSEGLLAAFPGLVLNNRGDITCIAHFARQVEQLLDNKQDKDLSMRVNALFALSNYYDKTREYATAYQWLTEANKTMQTTLRYDVENDGKLMNRIKKCYRKDRFDSVSDHSELKHNPIFVLGMPRSGTTLIEQILASHSQVFGCGELNFVNDLNTDLTILNSLSKSAKTAATITEFRTAYFDKVLPIINGARYFVDKMPGNFLHIGLIGLSMPNAKIIHCKRNAIETCFSIYRQNFSGSHGYSYDIANLKKYFQYYSGLMDYWSELLPDQILHVDYESVVTDNETQVRRMLGFLDLKFEDSCLKSHQTNRVVSTASSAQVRQPLYQSALAHTDHYPEFVSEWNQS